jgi:hypothetical protein
MVGHERGEESREEGGEEGENRLGGERAAVAARRW